MRPIKNIILIVLLSLIFLIPVDMMNVGITDDPPGDMVSKDVKVDNECGTRSTTSARSNFEISSSSLIKMPVVHGSWTQSDWSGGPGQAIWSNETRYSSSVNINDTSSNGPLKLSDGEDVDIWKQLKNGFGARYRHGMVWNPSKEVFHSFGGVVGTDTMVNELYEYNPATEVWTRRGMSGGPSARCSALVVYDNKSNLLWVYGGRDRANPGGNQFNDLWAYNPNTDQWTQKSDGPGARSDSAGAFNPNTREIIVYGGYIGGTAFSSNQVFAYNTLTDKWTMKHNYTKRYYHDAVWCPYTNSMMVYGGAEQWSGDFTYVNELNEYFPETDTWVNRTPIGNRVRSILVWDTLNNKLILHGGGEPDRNDTWVYDTDTDTWTARSDGPHPARDRVGGDWDTVRNRLVTFGGTVNQVGIDEVWVFSPNATGYTSNGGLVSSVYTHGSKINLESVSFELAQPRPPGVDANSVKIQVAGSGDPTITSNEFVGYSGTGNTYFMVEGGQPTPAVLDGSNYIAYKVNLSTSNVRNTPRLNWVKIDYYTYPASHSYISEVDDTNLPGLPLRFVNWTSKEPDNTGIELYFRQATLPGQIISLEWEKIERGQTEFEFKGGQYFQYRVDLTTTDPCNTPELTGIRFVFNAEPEKPTLQKPVDKAWAGSPKPTFNWTFNDPDTGDYQTALELNIGVEESFSYISYTSNVVESEENGHTIELPLEDGDYYWRVRLRDNYGSWGPWSEVYSLKLDTRKPMVYPVESLSHPSEHVWYSNDMPSFTWPEATDSSGIAGYGYILDPSPTATVPSNVTMTVEEYKLRKEVTDFKGLVIYDNIADGIWYFHLKAVDNLGTWSDTCTKKVMIDNSPAIVTDFTPRNVTAGSNFKFRFALNDSLSGVNIASISWLYSSQGIYQSEELIMDQTESGMYSLDHSLKISSDRFINYYLEVTDHAEQPNILRYPASGHVQIGLIDKDPPVIINCTGDKDHNKFTDIEITVEATDNLGVSGAKIYFNDQTTGVPMTKESGGKFSFKMDRVELVDISGYAGDDLVIYNIIVNDYHDNTARAPESGNYKITLMEIDDKEKSGGNANDEDLFSNALLINIIILAVIIVIVGIFLFRFIRKESEKMDRERHKLRMAIADVEDTQLDAGISPIAMQGASGLERVPSLYGTATGGPEDTYPSRLPSPVSTQAVPAAFLPEAQDTQDVGPSSGFDHDIQQPQNAETPTEAKDEKDKEPVVEVQKGLFVSLPKGDDK